MKIVFNTRYPTTASARFYLDALQPCEQVICNDRDHYNDFDVALFMTYFEDLKDLVEAKKQNPRLKIGLLDPRGSQVSFAISSCDFLVVDSIEMRDFFAKYHLPIFTYYEYPTIRDVKHNHEKKEPVVIAYHGNKVHLMGMYPNITRALELLGKKYKIEFWPMYNIEKLGKWNLGIPQGIRINHIQWSNENYHYELSKADIGIVPALMPIRSLKKTKYKAIVSSELFNDSPDDYLLRFKMPSNPGRIITFANLGIPVVADMYPSALQFIRDGYNGFVAHSCGGWYRALETLIVDHRLRQVFADRMKETVSDTFEYRIQTQRFLSFLEDIVAKETRAREDVIEEPTEDFRRNPLFWKVLLRQYYYRTKHGVGRLLKRAPKRKI